MTSLTAAVTELRSASYDLFRLSGLGVTPEWEAAKVRYDVALAARDSHPEYQAPKAVPTCRYCGLPTIDGWCDECGSEPPVARYFPELA